MAEQRNYTEEEAEAILRLAARTTTGNIPRERLEQMASELGLSSDQLAQAESEYLAKKSEVAEREAFLAHRKRELLSHVGYYVAINLGLLAMDFFPDGHLSWAMWSVLGWGIGIASHVACYFFADADSEEREFRKWRDKRHVEPLSMHQRQVLDEIALAEPRSKIEAIKELRERLNLDLRAAKDAVDQYEVLNPDLFRR